MNKFLSYLTLAFFIFSCKKDQKQETKETMPKDKIHSLSISFFNTTDSSVEYAGIYDEDADGPLQPNISGALLKKGQDYKVEIRLEDQTNPSVPIILSNKIKINSSDYIVCYTQNFGATISNYDKDKSGQKLGTTFDLKTGSNALTGQLEMTIKWQKGVKNGQCEPGELYYKATIPVFVQ